MSELPTSEFPEIPVVALVGGIGAGKSAVARLMAELVPAEILDADKLGHAVLLEPDVIHALTTEFGAGVLDETGQIQRRKLAERVFGETPERQAARARLEAISHPRIRAAIRRRVDELRATGSVRLIVLDAPILLESGWTDLVDRIVFIEAPEAVRRERVATRGWSPEELQKREQSQWTLERKRAAAHDSVGNGCSLDETRQAVSELLRRWGLLENTP